LTNQVDILNSQVNECCGGVVPKELFLFLLLVLIIGMLLADALAGFSLLLFNPIH
jgi:hypothetical protein